MYASRTFILIRADEREKFWRRRWDTSGGGISVKRVIRVGKFIRRFGEMEIETGMKQTNVFAGVDERVDRICVCTVL